jgi:hypothetical protein
VVTGEQGRGKDGRVEHGAVSMQYGGWPGLNPRVFSSW